jgi:hypothetical protein
MKRTSFLFAIMFVFGCNKTEITIVSPPAQALADAGSGSIANVPSDAGSVIAPDTARAATVVPDSGTAMDTTNITDTVRTDIVPDNGSISDAIPALDTQAPDGTVADLVPDLMTDAKETEVQSVDAITATFKIVSVEVWRSDGAGNLAEDVRTFKPTFSSPAKNLLLTINEKATGAIFRMDSYWWDGTTALSSELRPGAWTEKLKTNTTYIWSLRAEAATPVVGAQSDIKIGEFTTAICFAGQTRACYGGLPKTRGVGQCHDGTNACVVTSQGTYWNQNCIGETTPYPYGDKCGDGVDNDCDGQVDNSILMEVPAGQSEAWNRTDTDGEVLRFNVNAKNTSSTHYYWMNIQVEMKGVNVGYYRLWVMAQDGTWNNISSAVNFFDGSGGGYQTGMKDLGSNSYTGSSTWFNLGIQWKDLVGPTLNGGVVNYMLVATVHPYSSGSLRHYAPHSESSCNNNDGKTITFN